MLLLSSPFLGLAFFVCISETEEVNSVLGDELTPCQDPPLLEAVRRGTAEDIKQLIRNGGDPYAAGCKGESVMEVAINTENVDAILALVGNRFDLNRRLPSGVTAVKHALLKKPRLVPLVLKLGGKLDAISEPGEKTLLDVAAEDGDVRLALSLVKFGAPVESPGRMSPMERAIVHNQPAMVNFLFVTGANLTDNPLHLAVKNRSTDSLRALLQLGVSVDSHTLDTQDAIWEAVKRDFLEGATLLKEFGAKVTDHTFDLNSNSLLHMAALHGSVTCIQWLVSSGISVEEGNAWGNTPLHIAVSANQIDAAKVLIHLGASMYTKNNHGQTALQMARWHGHEKILKFLSSTKGP